MVGAVVALIGAAHTAGVGQLPHAGCGGIDAGSARSYAGRGRLVDVGHWPFRFVNDFSVPILERQAANAVPILPTRDSLRQFEQGQFALASDNASTKGSRRVCCVARLACQPPKTIGRSGRKFLHCSRDPNRSSDVRPGQNRNAQAESVFRFAQDRVFVIRGEQIIDELDVESGCSKWRGETQQGQAARLTAARRTADRTERLCSVPGKSRPL